MKNQHGQIIIIAMVFMLIILTMVSSLVAYALISSKAHKQALNREKALDIAEAGVEVAIWKLNNGTSYTGETNTSFGGGTYTVTMTTLTGFSKIVKVDGYFPNSTNPLAHRTIQVTAIHGTKNFGFKYGVQAGNGGFIIDNNATLVGNIYANGNIVGCNNGCTITGDAFVAGSSGSISRVAIQGNSHSHTITNSSVTQDASHYTLTSTSVGGNASVNSLNGPSCSVAGNATYNTKTNCTVTGTSTTPNNNVPADPASLALPIDETQISAWEAEAAAGGTQGTTVISTNQTLGPKKITGDLTINATVTMTGTIWVTGNITFNNGSILNLDPNYGALSGEIIAGSYGDTAHGYINVSNGSQINGSGVSGSYIMLLSERDTTANSNIAITAGNNVAAAILYANYGLIEVVNRATLKEITGWKIHLNNETEIIYDTGYGSAEFSTGPTGGWEVQEQTWQLLL